MLPLKTRIFEYAIQEKRGITIDDIMRDLANEYSGERIFTRKIVAEYIDSFLGVGFMKTEKIEFDENGELKVSCIITDYGLSRQKFLPSSKKS